jgi:thiol-disulfide isomerase/thioredoxin
LSGQKVLLVFSDPHCGPCQTLAPQLEQLHREHPELRVVMISRGEPRDNRAKVKQFKLTFPIVLQQHWEVSRRYAMFATPIGYLIDERGLIARDVALGAEGVMQLVPPAAGGRNLSSHQLP